MTIAINQPHHAAPIAVRPQIVRPHDADDIRMARGWAEFYRGRGWNPIPSRPDEKRPFIRWSEYLDKVFPEEQFQRFDTGSLQLMTGRRWGLIVVDLDGPEGIAQWPSMGTNVPRTWITHSGGDGRHIWFTVPQTGRPILSGRLWGIWQPEARDGRGDWAKHKGVEILADRKLVMAPPSLHPTTGRRYRFVGGHSPKDISRPALAPSWLLNLPRLSTPRPVSSIPFTSPSNSGIARKAPSSLATPRYDWRAVLDVVYDKVALARSWGLSFASEQPNSSGWCSCHAISRSDRNPSASFHAETGRYWEADCGSIGLFDLGVQLGQYRDWKEAVSEIGYRFHAIPMSA